MGKRKWIVVLLLIGLFFYWQNFAIQKEECIISCPKLPLAFEGLRIVHISDLHGRRFDGKSLVQKTAQAEPQLICITGDLFEKEEDLPLLEELLPALCEIAPTYYVTGNHEWQLPKLSGILKDMEELGVHVLYNSYEVLEQEGERMIIAGVNDPCGPADQKPPQSLIQEIHRDYGQDVFILMLSHRNDQLELWAELGVDLVLSGHAHGGVVRLPYVGGVFGTQRQLFPEYDAGLYRKGTTALYVSRGLGYSRVKLRLFNRPHLPVLELKR